MSKKHKKTRKPEELTDQDQPSQVEPKTQEQLSPQEELETLRSEKDNLLGRLQRVSADYVNYQKRVQRDASITREFANAELMKSLLGVLDDMERALEAARENHDKEDPFLKGMQLVHDKAMETLGKFGLTAIEAEGKRFDPDKHSAMTQEPSAEHPPMTVLRELQTGYELKGRTLRPSAVVVSKAPEDVPAAQQEKSNETSQTKGQCEKDSQDTEVPE
jgi:molecular chaperone GrpE